MSIAMPGVRDSVVARIKMIGEYIADTAEICSNSEERALLFGALQRIICTYLVIGTGENLDAWIDRELRPFHSKHAIIEAKYKAEQSKIGGGGTT